MFDEKEEHLAILEKMFIDSGAYSFSSERLGRVFIADVLWKAECEYTDENYYREYPDFKDFLYTHHVDTIAYWTASDFE